MKPIRLFALLLALLLPAAAIAELPPLETASDALALDVGKPISLPLMAADAQMEELFALPDGAAGVLYHISRSNQDRQGDNDLALLVVSADGAVRLHETLGYPHYASETWLDCRVLLRADGAALEICDPDLEGGVRYTLTRTDTGYALTGQETLSRRAGDAIPARVSAYPFQAEAKSGSQWTLANLETQATAALSFDAWLTAGACDPDGALFLLAAQGDDDAIDLRWYSADLRRVLHLRLGGADSLIGVTATSDRAWVVTARRRDYRVIAIDPAARALLWSQDMAQQADENDCGVAATAEGPVLLFASGQQLRLVRPDGVALEETVLDLAAPLFRFAQQGHGPAALLLWNAETGKAYVQFVSFE